MSEPQQHDNNDEKKPENKRELRFGDMTLRRIRANNGKKHITRMLVDGLILYGGTCMLSGPPKTGKTWLTIDLIVSVATQKPFLGHIGVETGPVMICSPEGPIEELEDRIRQVCARKGIDPDSLDLYLVDKKQLFLDSEVDQETIRDGIKEVRPALVVFDPMAECFGGDENRSDDVKVMSRFLNSVAHEFNTTILLTHHCTKDGTSMRGSSALKAFPDSLLYLEKSKSGKVTLTNEQRHGVPSAPIHLDLTIMDGNTAYKAVCQETDKPELKEDPTNKILTLLKETGKPMSQRELRMVLKGTAASYPGYLKELKEANLIEKGREGWQIKAPKSGSKINRTTEPDEGGSVWSTPIGTQPNRTTTKTTPKSFISKWFGGKNP